jgi:hypothetical protein
MKTNTFKSTGIRTYDDRRRNPFRMRTYKKQGGGILPPPIGGPYETNTSDYHIKEPVTAKHPSTHANRQERPSVLTFSSYLSNLWRSMPG